MSILKTRGTGSLSCTLNRRATLGTLPSCSRGKRFTQSHKQGISFQKDHREGRMSEQQRFLGHLSAISSYRHLTQTRYIHEPHWVTSYQENQAVIHKRAHPMAFGSPLTEHASPMLDILWYTPQNPLGCPVVTLLHEAFGATLLKTGNPRLLWSACLQFHLSGI